MKKSEIIFASLAFIALILKLTHLPGANFLLVISLSCLGFLYFYLGLALFNNILLRKIAKKDAYKDISALRLIGVIGAGIALSLTSISILFKLLNWPQASFQLQAGLIGLMLILIVGYVRYSKTKAAFYPSLFLRTAILGSLGVLLLII